MVIGDLMFKVYNSLHTPLPFLTSFWWSNYGE